MKKSKKKKIIVCASGGFDPIHSGHVRLLKEAKKLGDELVVLVNNDNWLSMKKGNIFMNQNERKALLEAIRYVDKVVITSHKKNDKDKSVCRDLRKLKPNVFANGGDRTLKNIPEAVVCEELGIKMVFNVGKGGKIQSSSWLLKKYTDQVIGSKKR